MEMSGHLHAPAALPPGKEPPLPIEQEAEWTPEQVWTRCRREKFPALAGNRTSDHPARSQPLNRLNYPGSQREMIIGTKRNFILHSNVASLATIQIVCNVRTLYINNTVICTTRGVKISSINVKQWSELRASDDNDRTCSHCRFMSVLETAGVRISR
jgi:hypothetical protein